jgi:hypothetical protein
MIHLVRVIRVLKYGYEVALKRKQIEHTFENCFKSLI